MRKEVIVYLTIIFCLQACSNKEKYDDKNCKSKVETKIDTKKVDGNMVTAKNSDEEISCKLTTEELRIRKETVIASLKKQVIEKKELTTGYSFKFIGSDKIIDELAEFVKSERSCCNFFVFNLSFSGDGKEAWLSLTGPDGAKEMITEELGL